MAHRTPGAPRRASPALRLAIVLPIAIVVSMAPPTGELAAQSPPESPEVLRPGDVLRVQVWRQPEFSGEFEVTDRGVIAHPLYRDVTAGGRPVAEVEETLRSFLREYEESPNFVIQGLFRVAVGGEVRQPNMHLLPPGTTVAEAVAVAGGISDRGRLDRVVLRRGNGQYRLDLTNPSARLREITIRSGDEIVVERRRQIFREVIGPTASIVAAAAALARLFID